MSARATGNLVTIGVWLIHLSINVIGALIFMLLLKPFSQIVRRIADTIAASPRLTIAVTVIFHLISASIIIYYALGAHL